MKPYRVIGPHVQFGAGTLLGLSLAQIDTRRHLLGDIDMNDKSHGTAVANQILTFKAGEVVALGPKHVMSRFEEDNLEAAPGARVGEPGELASNDDDDDTAAKKAAEESAREAAAEKAAKGKAKA